jgi:hypothetical protein
MGKILFSFLISVDILGKNSLQVSEARGRGQQEGEASAGSSDSSFRRYYFKFHAYLSLKFYHITVICSINFNRVYSTHVTS